jgi:hypothetical protein
MAELDKVRSVIKQDGNEVQVSIPMAGFQEGFELQPGDKVTVLYENGNPVARPLIHMKAVEPASDKSSLEASAGGDYSLESASVVDTGGDNDRLEAYIIDSDSDRERAVAVLPKP